MSDRCEEEEEVARMSDRYEGTRRLMGLECMM